MFSSQTLTENLTPEVLGICMPRFSSVINCFNLSAASVVILTILSCKRSLDCGIVYHILGTLAGNLAEILRRRPVPSERMGNRKISQEERFVFEMTKAGP